MVKNLENDFPHKRIRLMFEDEAGFGRINKPKHCWCKKGTRPSVPCHHIREYRYLYGAVEPLTGDSFFLIMPACNKETMKIYLENLSEQYKDDIIVLACDGARWHISKELEEIRNIKIVHIPPYTPEMNPIEQICKEIRKIGFKNEIFQTLEKVMDRLCESVNKLTNHTIKSITCREWISSIF